MRSATTAATAILTLALTGACVMDRTSSFSARRAESERLNPLENPMPRHWQIAGPFPAQSPANPAKPAFTGGAIAEKDKAFPTVAMDESTRWLPVKRAGDLVDMEKHLGGKGRRLGYARTELHFDEETTAVLMFAGTGAKRVWLDGRLVYRIDDPGGTLDKRDSIFTARFAKGTNRLVLEVESGARGWAFSLTLADLAQPWLYERCDYSRATLRLSVAPEMIPGERLVRATAPRWAKAAPEGPALITLRDWGGKVIESRRVQLADGTTVAPPGAGIFCAEVFQRYEDGADRAGTLWFAQGDVTGLAAALRSRAERWLDGAGRADARQRGRVLFLTETTFGRSWRTTAPALRNAYEAAALRRLLDELETGRDALGGRRGTFLWAFVSGTDGSGQPISISLPDDYRADRAYPLIVYLHGSGGNWLSEAVRSSPSEEPYIQISGDWRSPVDRTYSGLSELDIGEAIAFMKANFRIDPARVYQLGHSCGGYASWRLACRYPDWFAAVAPHAGLPEADYLSNLRNTPVRAFHGLKDQGVCPVWAFHGAEQVRKAGGSADAVGYPAAGHWVYGANGDAVRWLLRQRMEALPQTVDFTTRWVSRGRNRSRWVTVRELQDPHRVGRVMLTAKPSSLTGTVRNVSWLEIRSARELFGRDAALQLDVNGFAGGVDAPLPETITIRFAPDGEWESAAAGPEAHAEPVYSAGSLQNLFDGQPVRIVVSDGGGDEAHRQAVLKGARQLALHGAHYGGIPILEDREVDAWRPGAHLIVLGSPANNSCMKALLGLLPLRESDGKVAVPVLGEYELQGRGYAFCYYHPRQPRYRVVLFRSDSPGYFRDMLSVLPDGRYDPDMGAALDAAPDFALFDVAARRFLRTAYLGKDWKFPAEYADSPKLDPRLADRRELYGRLGEALRRVSKADYAFTLYDDEPRVDPTVMRTADLACLARAVWGVGLVDGVVVDFDDNVMKYVVDRSHDKALVGKAYDPYALWPWPEKPWTKSGGKYTVCLLGNRFQDFGTVTRAKWARAEHLTGSVRPAVGDFLRAFLAAAVTRQGAERK